MFLFNQILMSFALVIPIGVAFFFISSYRISYIINIIYMAKKNKDGEPRFLDSEG